MIKCLLPQTLVLRHALSAAGGIFLAVLADHYYSSLHACWVPLVALLVMQRTLRPALQNFLLISVMVIVGSVVFSFVPSRLVISLIVVAIFIIACYVRSRLSGSSSITMITLLPGVLMLMFLTPIEAHSVYTRMHDVVLGGVVGILSSLVIFPLRADVDFRQGVIPILNAAREYLLALAALLFNPVNDQAQAKKRVLEETLQTQQALFPEWIYEPGFNLALQKGHRHFLLKVEQLAQVLFAMHYAMRHDFNPELLAAVRQPIERCILDAEKWMVAIVALLELQKLQGPVSSLEEDILALQEAFKSQGSVPLELASEVPDYLHFSAILFNLKDLQKVLLKLSEALR